MSCHPKPTQTTKSFIKLYQYHWPQKGKPITKTSKKKNYIWIAKSKKSNPNDRGNLLAKSKLKSVKNSERTLQIPKISRKL